MSVEQTKIACIFGITGQDGSYLAEYLLEKNYTVYGVIRRCSSFNTWRLNSIRNRVNLIYGDVSDAINVLHIVKMIQPDEIYNLAAMSHVGISFDLERYTTDVDACGPLHILQAIRMCNLVDKTKFYQASTSEMFGNSMNEHSISCLTIESPMKPCSPYAIAKYYAHLMVQHYRKAYGFFAVSGVLFNHESPRRGENFVTQKVVTWAKEYFRQNKKVPLQIGNLDSTRDWGHAKDYIKGMWLMLQQDNPNDFVLATGKQVSVRCFIESVCKRLGVEEIIWEGQHEEEKGYLIDKETGEKVCLIEVNKKYYRPNELTDLRGDSTDAEQKLGWKREYDLDGLIDDMLSN